MCAGWGLPEHVVPGRRVLEPQVADGTFDLAAVDEHCQARRASQKVDHQIQKSAIVSSWLQRNVGVRRAS